jgi:predicted RNase H-like HicB family nuclease
MILPGWYSPDNRAGGIDGRIGGGAADGGLLRWTDVSCRVYSGDPRLSLTPSDWCQLMSKPSAKPKKSTPSPGSPQPLTIVVKVELRAIALPEAEGGYTVVVPALEGCFTQGDTIEEVQANVVEAAEAWLEAAHEETCDAAVRGMLE